MQKCVDLQKKTQMLTVCNGWKRSYKDTIKNSIFLNQAVQRTEAFEASLFYRYGKHHIVRAIVQRKAREF